MRYSYSAAWAVIGGVSLPDDSESIELARSTHSRFVLTRDPDSLLTNFERGDALGRLMLKGLVGQRGATEFPNALEAEIKEIRAERKNKTGAHTVLVLEAQGDISATVNRPAQEHDGYIITFDAVDKQEIRRAHQSEIEAMKAALAFESDVPSRFAALGENTYLIDASGTIIYSITFKFSAEMTTSSPLSSDGAMRISDRYGMLRQADYLTSVQRLFSQTADFGTDRLRAFLSGWASLEILIAKSFNLYEQDFLSPLTNAGQPIRERFLGRIRIVMKDKYRLADKFVAVAAVLFPAVPDAELQEDYAQFCRFKKIRDLIYHGEEFSDSNLPVHELSMLLRKYVVSSISTSTITAKLATTKQDI